VKTKSSQTLLICDADEPLPLHHDDVLKFLLDIIGLNIKSGLKSPRMSGNRLR